jgi:ribose-phosphate pyrophosphokinase
MLDALFVTNASYRSEEVLAAPWYKEVNVIKYIAFYIYSVNSKKAVSKIMDPHQKIVDLLDKYKRKY